MKPVTQVTLLALLIILCGCSTNLKVTGQFPAPLIAPIPQTVGVLYDDSFRDYAYTETQADRHKWVIESGAAQVQLFDQILNRLFLQAEVVESLPSPQAPAPTDLVIYPQLTDFQYSVPRETQFKIYEVWLKYNLSVYTAQGVMLADWVVTAYGKTRSAFMQSEEEAMNAAVVVALRDLGANLALGTAQVPEISAWIAARTSAQPVLATPTQASLQEGSR